MRVNHFILKIFIGFLMTSFFFSLLFSSAQFYQISAVNHQNSQNAISNKETLHTSASLNFAQPPSLSAIYFNPAKNESTVYSFSQDQDANFSLNISAYYEPINLNKTFTLTYGDIGWYYNSSGTYFVVVNPGSVDPTVPQDLFLGIGKNASSLIWQDLGGVNATAGIAVCSRGPQIRIVYLEKNSTG